MTARSEARAAAKVAGAKRYLGRLCKRGHGWLKYTSSGHCVVCSDASSLRQKRADPEANTAAARKWQRDNQGKHNALQAKRRTRKKNAHPLWHGEDMDRLEIQDIYTRATAQGMQVDHVVPLAPCRDCGAKGQHTAWNLQLLTPLDNSSKGNRCQKCWDEEKTRQRMKQQEAEAYASAALDGREELGRRYDQWAAAGKPIPPKLPADGWGIIPEDPSDDRFARWLEGPDYS